MAPNNQKGSGSGSGSGFSAPKPIPKRSVFERQRAEAEAKRQREAAETAAIYEDFVKSFGDGGQDSSNNATMARTTGVFSSLAPPPSSQPPMPLKTGPTMGSSSGGRRHFSMPASAVHHPPTTPARRRERDEGARSGRTGVGSRLAFDDDDDDDDGGNDNRDNYRDDNGQGKGDYGGGGGGTTGENLAADRAEEKAAAKPTLRLANLPPTLSPAAVRALVASSGLHVDHVRMLPLTATATATTMISAAMTDRKSGAAIVTLETETAASEIEAAVSALQNRYLGYGYYLSLHRHLSSAVVASSSAMSAGAVSGSRSSSTRPFGARPVPAAEGASSASSSLPGGGGAGFAPPPLLLHGRPGGGIGIPPPSSYGSGTGSHVRREGILHVPVQPPRNIKTLRMIHKVVESVLEHGPELEALLMSRPDVQREEKWAWLWDARSTAGVWYRFRLWETATGLRARRTQQQRRQKQPQYMPLFEDSPAWKVPNRPLPYESVTAVSEFVSDSEYNSSDDSEYEADGDVGTTTGGGGGAGAGSDTEDVFLSPLGKAKLAHMLARLPVTMSKLRKGDIARVTAFAITHASRGADEVVDLIVTNIETPFALAAAPNAKATNPAAAAESQDASGAQLVAVYVVSDILAASAMSGIRHAWRYRQLFETALRSRQVFAGLGQLGEKLHWGRLRVEKWRRSIGLVLSLWEGWSVFSAATHDFLVQSFENPPSSRPAEDSNEGEGGVAGAAGGAALVASTKKSRWKTVDLARPTVGAEDEAGAAQAAGGEETAEGGAANADAGAGADADAGTGTDNDMDADADADAASEGYRSEYTDDEELDLACLEEEDIDGEPMSEAEADGIPLTAEEIAALKEGIVEMSEEGEIGSDEDGDGDGDSDSHGYGYSSDSQGDGDDDGHGGPPDHGPDQDQEMTDVSTGPTASAGQADGVEHRGPTVSAASEPEPETAAGFRMSVSSAAAPRKRMRAADLFADSDGE